MENIYIPEIVKIKKIKRESIDSSTFFLSFLKKKDFNFIPGQFIELSIFGVGEAPFSLSSSPLKRDLFEICVKRMGRLTNRLFELKVGDEVGIRGPYGNGFQIESLKGKNLILLAGGIGLAPLKGLIEYILSFRDEFKDILILYGAKTPKEIIFKDIFPSWEEKAYIELTVDIKDEGWSKEVGPVTNLLKNVKIDPNESKAVICGPPLMIENAIKRLKDLGFADRDIITTLERYMKCGVGKCGHCLIGDKYTCIDGPVFTYEEIKKLREEY
jgi:sulfite reductase subunit B